MDGGWMFDNVMRALAHGNCRHILLGLLDAESYHLWQAHNTANQSTPQQYKIIMNHRHLPKLADDGFIHWDQDQGIVSRGPNFETLRPVLTALDSRRDELPPGYLPAEVGAR